MGNFSSIKRADCIFINGEKNLDFEDKVIKIKKNLKIFYTRYKIKNLEKFSNKKFIAFAGIGNPQNFFDLLRENKIDIKQTISFSDHHDYTEKDFSIILKKKENFKNDISILTTEKDYSRMNQDIKKNFEFVEVNLEIENKQEFINLIRDKL